jgi:hypothetical protein
MIVSAVFHRRVRTGRVTNVFVVQIDVHEVAQRVLIVEEMASQRGVRGCERVQRFARSIRFTTICDWPSGELAQRRRMVMVTGI